MDTAKEQLRYTKETTEKFCKNLKHLRLCLNMTQTEFAKLLGVSRGAISYYEKGERLPDIGFLANLNYIFDLPPNYLLGYSETVRSDFSDFRTVLGLSEIALRYLSNDKGNTLGKTISKIIEHDKFYSLYVTIRGAIECGTRAYEEGNPISSSRHFAWYLCSGLITEILSDVLEDMYKAKIMEKYTEDDIKAYMESQTESILSFLNTQIAEDEDDELDEEHELNELSEIRRKIHHALGDTEY